jgi:hypothetical protein
MGLVAPLVPANEYACRPNAAFSIQNPTWPPSPLNVSVFMARIVSHEGHHQVRVPKAYPRLLPRVENLRFSVCRYSAPEPSK